LTVERDARTLNHMVNYSAGLNETFGALADPTRRAILASLAQGEASVSELAEPHRMSLPAVLKHLTVLERAGLVAQQKEGRVRRCRLIAEPLKEAGDWIAGYRSFWERQLESLDRYLAEQKEGEKQSCPVRNLPPRTLRSGGRSPRSGKRSSAPGPLPKN